MQVSRRGFFGHILNSKLGYNKYFYSKKEGLLYIHCIGDQSSKTVFQLHQDTKKILENLRKEGKKVLSLINLKKLGRVGLSARIASVEIIKASDFDKTAIFGDAFLNKHLINAIVLASGKSFQIRYFSNEEDAKDWLLQT